MKREVSRITLIIFLLSILIIPSFIHSSVETTSPIQINAPPSDVYADDVIYTLTAFIRYGEKALGAPDGEYTELFEEYGNGYITLDMGEYEKIWNGTGDDFTVHSHSGQYIVKVGNNIHQPLFTIGSFSDTTSFDLNDTGLEYVQYVQIHYSAGGEVYLDAIEAIHLEVITPETDTPIITPVEDFWVYDNQTSVDITWYVTDIHPWNYSIIIEGEEYQTGLWLEEEINLSYIIEKPGNITVQLYAYDFFGYYSLDEVEVEIRGTGKTSALPIVLSLLSLLGLTIALNKRNN